MAVHPRPRDLQTRPVAQDGGRSEVVAVPEVESFIIAADDAECAVSVVVLRCGGRAACYAVCGGEGVAA